VESKPSSSTSANARLVKTRIRISVSLENVNYEKPFSFNAHIDEIERLGRHNMRSREEPKTRLSVFDRQSERKATARISAHDMVGTPDEFPKVLVKLRRDIKQTRSGLHRGSPSHGV
jgi:hypothetical protein